MEDKSEVPAELPLIEKIIAIQGIKGEVAAKLRTPVSGAPEDVAKNFQWAKHLTKPENYLPQLAKFFARHPDFPIAQNEIATCWQSAFDQAEKIYKIMYPEGTPQLQYHNLLHAKVTAVTANKMLLGALVTQPEYQNMDSNLMYSIIKLSAIASVFHEINDWWHLGPNPYLAKAKILLEEYLTEQGLSTMDFNRLIALDHFKKPVEEVVDTAMDPALMKEEDKFLKDNGVPSVIDKLNADTKKSLLTLIGHIFVSSDFCQILNPGYHQPAQVTVGVQSYATNTGAAALAVEASEMRPQSLPEIGFGNDKGEIFWGKVKFGADFFKYALSKIKDGFSHLRAFDPEEYQRAYDSLEAISINFGLADYFKENFPNAATA